MRNLTLAGSAVSSLALTTVSVQAQRKAASSPRAGAVSLTRTALSWMHLGSEGQGLARDDLPLRQGGGASFLVGLSIDEMAFQAEVVVDVGVH